MTPLTRTVEPSWTFPAHPRDTRSLERVVPWSAGVRTPTLVLAPIS
jgi:hypothetical protein